MINNLDKKRISAEIHKLIQKNFIVTLINNSPNDLQIVLPGPKDTPYLGGRFIVNIHIPIDYPFKSPSIGFGTKMFHPNIDENSGSICLDVLNQVWSPMYDMLNVMEIFLPQLLAYPNPHDPLNSDAAQLYIKDREAFNNKVREYVAKYCVVQQEKESSEEDVIDSDDLEL